MLRSTWNSLEKISKFSYAVRSPSTETAWGTYPILCRIWEGFRTALIPRSEIDPEVGLVSVMIMRIVVVLPAPFGPSKPKTSPSSTLKLIPFTATMPFSENFGELVRLQSRTFLFLLMHFFPQEYGMPNYSRLIFVNSEFPKEHSQYLQTAFRCSANGYWVRTLNIRLFTLPGTFSTRHPISLREGNRTG